MLKINGPEELPQYSCRSVLSHTSGTGPSCRPNARHLSGKRSKAEELGLYQGAVPTRTWKPGKVWVARDGIFPKSPKCLNTYAPFESMLEALAHLHLSVDFRVQHYVCQPAPLNYWMPGVDGGQDKREYTPDFVALTRDQHLLVIDAKAVCYATNENWKSREPYIRAAYRTDHDADLIVWTERELQAEPRLSNARTMYRHRHAPLDRSIDFAVRSRLEAVGGISTIGWLCDQISNARHCDPSEVFGSIMRLALAGEILLGSGAKYGRDTEVRFWEATV